MFMVNVLARRLAFLGSNRRGDRSEDDQHDDDPERGAETAVPVRHGFSTTRFRCSQQVM